MQSYFNEKLSQKLRNIRWRRNRRSEGEPIKKNRTSRATQFLALQDQEGKSWWIVNSWSCFHFSTVCILCRSPWFPSFGNGHRVETRYLEWLLLYLCLEHGTKCWPWVYSESVKVIYPLSIPFALISASGKIQPGATVRV